MGTVPQSEQDDTGRLYAAFNRREIDAVLDRLAPDVQWANGLEGGHARGAPQGVSTGRAKLTMMTRAWNPK